MTENLPENHVKAVAKVQKAPGEETEIYARCTSGDLIKFSEEEKMGTMTSAEIASEAQPICRKYSTNAKEEWPHVERFSVEVKGTQTALTALCSKTPPERENVFYSEEGALLHSLDSAQEVAEVITQLGGKAERGCSGNPDVPTPMTPINFSNDSPVKTR